MILYSFKRTNTYKFYNNCNGRSSYFFMLRNSLQSIAHEENITVDISGEVDTKD